jgi:hypothetical protein
LVLFGVIPAKAGIQVFRDLRSDWTPVFTGVTNEFQFFHSFRGERGDFCRGFAQKGDVEKYGGFFKKLLFYSV